MAAHPFSMELLKEVSDGLIPSKKILEEFKERNAARAVLLDKENKVALIYNPEHKHHKLLGRGLKENEKPEEAIRELAETTGSEPNILGEIGKVVEYRHKYKLNQTSYGYLARVSGEIKNNGVKWVSLGEALELLEKDEPSNYEGSFIVKRELGFLRRARRILQMKSL